MSAGQRTIPRVGVLSYRWFSEERNASVWAAPVSLWFNRLTGSW